MDRALGLGEGFGLQRGTKQNVALQQSHANSLKYVDGKLASAFGQTDANYRGITRSDLRREQQQQQRLKDQAMNQGAKNPACSLQ